ncbi:hypothetical protein RCC89_19545 [Cytophagaceae bacterium ABcell3]|nr:hypothetical protein RCC89_19545 [Cytophagaceae bacterium ABcell3]
MAKGTWVHTESGEELGLGKGDGTLERSMKEFGWEQKNSTSDRCH